MRSPSFLTRRRPLLAVGALFLATVGVLLWLLLPVPLEERLNRIRPGMTTEDVEALIGSPPEFRGAVWPDSEEHIWFLDEGVVFVHFRGEGATGRVGFVPAADRPSLWDRLRARLPW